MKLALALLLIAAPAAAQVGPDGPVRDALSWDDHRNVADIVSTILVAVAVARPCLEERTFACVKLEALRVGLAVAGAELTKLAVSRERPNGYDDKSFYSEHTELACVTSWRRGRWMFCPGVAYLRIAADWHWSTDTMVGAAAGGALAQVHW